MDKRMKSKDKQMIGRTIHTNTMGYAYVYPKETGNREEYMVALTAADLANLIGGKGTDVWQIIVTDVMDRLVVNTRLGMLDTCPDQRLCGEIIRHLVPIQMVEKETGEILAVSWDAAEEYFLEEEQEVAMVECWMQ